MNRKRKYFISKNVFALILTYVENERYVTHEELLKKFDHIDDIDSLISQLRGPYVDGLKDSLIYEETIKRNNKQITVYALTIRGTEYLNSVRFNDLLRLQTYYNKVLAIATTFVAFFTIFLFFQGKENIVSLITYSNGSINILGILVAIILAGLLVYLIGLVFELIFKEKNH